MIDLLALIMLCCCYAFPMVIIFFTFLFTLLWALDSTNETIEDTDFPLVCKLSFTETAYEGIHKDNFIAIYDIKENSAYIEIYNNNPIGCKPKLILHGYVPVDMDCIKIPGSDLYYDLDFFR